MKRQRVIRLEAASSISSLPNPNELSVDTLGPCRFDSPLAGKGAPMVDETRRVLIPSDLRELQPYLETRQVPAFEPAGPRRQIFFQPSEIACGIVTCGGLCPGINNVIRSIVLTLHYRFGVRRILGYRYGFQGLVPGGGGNTPLQLGPEAVGRIHESGGTILGTSRGPQDVGRMVDTLLAHGISILFAIGGDGTQRGVEALAQEVKRRNLDIAIVGIPKTIDNDIPWVDRTFGFATATEAAEEAIQAAHEEARGAWNGVGLVKLMGRHSGFIAAHATLASADVNFCLIPEVPFTLKGKGGFLDALERRLDEKHHAVVVVAEAAGQDLLGETTGEEVDASGNVRFGDIGLFLYGQITRYFKERHRPVTIKYIDPSYMIRSLPANAIDAEFCLSLGQHAVHAGLAGKTNMLVGMWKGRFTHVPLTLVNRTRKQVDPSGEIWQRVLETTGQPASMAGQLEDTTG